jgi:hypothetical protein
MIENKYNGRCPDSQFIYTYFYIPATPPILPPPHRTIALTDFHYNTGAAVIEAKVGDGSISFLYTAFLPLILSSLTEPIVTW